MGSACGLAESPQSARPRGTMRAWATGSAKMASGLPRDRRARFLDPRRVLERRRPREEDVVFAVLRVDLGRRPTSGVLARMPWSAGRPRADGEPAATPDARDACCARRGSEVQGRGEATGAGVAAFRPRTSSSGSSLRVLVAINRVSDGWLWLPARSPSAAATTTSVTRAVDHPWRARRGARSSADPVRRFGPIFAAARDCRHAAFKGFPIRSRCPGRERAGPPARVAGSRPRRAGHPASSRRVSSETPDLLDGEAHGSAARRDPTGSSARSRRPRR